MPWPVLFLVLVTVVVRLILLNINSHRVDIVTPDPSQGLARRLISQEEPPAVRSLANDRIAASEAVENATASTST